jgi:hypothetical protein
MRVSFLPGGCQIRTVRSPPETITSRVADAARRHRPHRVGVAGKRGVGYSYMERAWTSGDQQPAAFAASHGASPVEAF